MANMIKYIKKSKIVGPVLSVIIPFYNTGKYIIRCLESVLNQSIDNIEIVIINDGSTDETEKKIEKFLNKANICYIELSDNYGVGNARNIGIKYAKSNRLAFLDSDDWIDLDCYYLMLKENEDLVICNIDTEYENSSSAIHRYKYLNNNTIDSSIGIRMFCHSCNYGNYISPLLGNKIFKKEIIIKNHIIFDENKYFEDDEFTFKYLLYCKKISLVSNTSFHYYQRNESIMHVFSQKHINDFFYIFKSLKKYLIEYNIYNEYRFDYYSLFDKCLNTIYKSMFNTTQDVETQKEYLYYIHKKFNKEINIKEYIDYQDINIIKNKMNYD